MKKYKLIETYPSIPTTTKKGTIVEWSEEMGLYHYARTLDTFKKSEVENFPKFWEEVKEDCIILKFEGVNKLTHPNMWIRTYGGLYLPEGKTSPAISLDVMLHTGLCVDRGDFIIHSVKCGREIFSIGDRVEHVGNIEGWKNCIVESFDYTKKRLRVVVRQDYATSTYDLDKLQVCRKPIFKTKDGVDIFEGDTFIVLDPETFAIGLPLTAKPHHAKDGSNLLHFSTKEAAEDYIIKNKPLISVVDVIKEFGDPETSGFTKRFIRIAKENYGVL